MGRIKNAITKLKNNYIRRRRRSKLKYKDFTIISNNCWAGTAVYQLPILGARRIWNKESGIWFFFWCQIYA